VKRSYRLAENGASNVGSLWKNIRWYQASVHLALMADDNSQLRGVFSNPEKTDLYYGVDNLSHTVLARSPANPDDGIRQDNAELIRTQILKLAEAMGLRRWLPTDGEMVALYYPGDHEVSPDVGETLTAISNAAGFDIVFPSPFEGEVGLLTDRGFASYRAVQALYQAIRVQQEISGIQDPTVLEIGPGMGRTAYYAKIAGIENYTTIDLPMGVVGQACFLGATLGPNAIWLYGEDPASALGKIKLLPGTMPLPEQQFGLVLNVDSLTEMGKEAGIGYAKWVANHATSFLSINHEANSPTVAGLARDHLSAFSSRRFPCWMRNGYVEEIFRFSRDV
jgi:hypothetical protein